jgi:hypothetical protein
MIRVSLGREVGQGGVRSRSLQITGAIALVSPGKMHDRDGGRAQGQGR